MILLGFVFVGRLGVREQLELVEALHLVELLEELVWLSSDGLDAAVLGDLFVEVGDKVVVAIGKLTILLHISRRYYKVSMVDAIWGCVLDEWWVFWVENLEADLCSWEEWEL